MLESNPTLAAAYTVNRRTEKFAVFHFIGKPSADKLRRPQTPHPLS